MDIFGALKSVADAFNNFMGRKTSSDIKKEETARKNEERKELLRKELAEAYARGDQRTIDIIKSKLLDDAQA